MGERSLSGSREVVEQVVSGEANAVADSAASAVCELVSLQNRQAHVRGAWLIHLPL
jgi:hypothetical protein